MRAHTQVGGEICVCAQTYFFLKYTPVYTHKSGDKNGGILYDPETCAGLAFPGSVVPVTAGAPVKPGNPCGACVSGFGKEACHHSKTTRK